MISLIYTIMLGHFSAAALAAACIGNAWLFAFLMFSLIAWIHYHPPERYARRLS